MEDRKSLIRMAGRVQEALVKLKGSRYLELMKQLASLAGKLQELTAESRKIGASLANGWFATAERCCKRVDRLLTDIPYSVSKIQPLTEDQQKEMPKLSVLVDELNQLQQEFGDIEFDSPSNIISVVTEPITLEDVYLGPFKIELQLNKLSELYQNSPYCIIALEPNPAATDESVTHPHVSNEKLCEGDAYTAIRSALQEGRLCDFFTMARSILNTYNPDSPYVSLDEWDGEPCYECGYVMSRDDSFYCSFCERVFCEECTTCCRSCNEVVCLGCAAKCESCEESVCPRCARIRCIECKCLCCESCIDEGLCPDCKEERDNEDEEQREPITKERERRNTSETSNSEIKLAS